MQSVQWETIGSCPVCQSVERVTLYEDLVDRVVGAVPGRFMLYTCGGCGSAYLDPRPDRETIGLAYRGYKVYADQLDEFAVPAGLKNQVKAGLRNGYMNWKFGTTLSPASPLGALLDFVPNQYARSGHWLCYLRRPDKPVPKLLDIGSGNGLFLRRMQQAGWEVMGVEPGEEGVQASKAHGLNVVHAALETWEGPGATFDAITMVHVIEHLHDPVLGINKVFDMLAPGGVFYVDTPNIGAYSHEVLKEYWFALDSPRHLILFSPKAMEEALEQAGFVDLKYLPGMPDADIMYDAAETWTRESGKTLSMGREEFTRNLEAVCRNDPKRACSLMLHAKKPDSCILSA
jgi:2-polyprenyl-3-methyl-5-hydroxy-6-metoxy-1,4-benzoquinol methylase